MLLRGNKSLSHPRIPWLYLWQECKLPSVEQPLQEIWAWKGKWGGIAAPETSGGKLIPEWQPDPLREDTGLNYTFLTGRVKGELRRKKENPKKQINLEVSSDFAGMLADWKSAEEKQNLAEEGYQLAFA